jgi:hypothetical protein
VYEIVAMLDIEYDIKASITTVKRCLYTNQWSKKMLKRTAAQQNMDLRIQWLATIGDYRPEQLVFIDESSCNEFAANRRYGWSPRGRSISYI